MLKKLSATGVLAAAAASGVLLFGGPAASADVHTSGDGSILGGTQVNVPIVVCGNNIGVIDVLSYKKASCQGAAWVGENNHHGHHHHHHGS